MPATKRNRSQQRRHGKPGAGTLRSIRPQMAGIDLGSREHWACRPVRDGGGAERGGFRGHSARAEGTRRLPAGRRGRVGRDGQQQPAASGRHGCAKAAAGNSSIPDH